MILLIFHLNENDRFELSSTSKGNQIKWYKDGFYIKANTMGYEGIVEALVSELLHFTDNKYGFVDYFVCDIFEGSRKYKGCYSKDCLEKGEQFISLYRLLQQSNRGIDKVLKKLNGTELVNFVIQTIRSITNLDISDYLGFILRLDWLILNEDRHLNNICLIYNKNTKTYNFAPIFDNGLSLLSDIDDYPFDTSTLVNMRNVKAKPFSTSFKKQCNYFSNSLLCIHYDDFIRSLDNVSAIYKSREFNRAKLVLLKNLISLEGVVWKRV